MLMTNNKFLRQAFGLAETANLLMLRLALTDRRAAHLFPGIIFRNYMALRQNGPWQSLPFEKIFPEFKGQRFTVEHLPEPGMDHPLEKLCYLALMTQIVQPKMIFEIGTYRGRTALNFALNSPTECKVYTLDLPPGSQAVTTKIAGDLDLIGRHTPGHDYQGKSGSEKITQLYGDSTLFDYTPYLGQADIVFVDGGHDFDTVFLDTRNALRLVKLGGVILWDDFGNYGEYYGLTKAVLDHVPAVEIEHTQLAIYRVPKAAESRSTEAA